MCVKLIVFVVMELDVLWWDVYVDVVCGGDEVLCDEVLWMFEVVDDISEVLLLLFLLGDLYDVSGLSVVGVGVC